MNNSFSSLSLFTFSFFHSSLLPPHPSFRTPFILCCFVSAWTSHRFFFVVVSSRSWYCEHCSLLSLSLKASGRFWSWLGGVSHRHLPAGFTPAVCVMKHVALTHIPPPLSNSWWCWVLIQVCLHMKFWLYSRRHMRGNLRRFLILRAHEEHETLTHGSFPLAVLCSSWQRETVLMSFYTVQTH